MRRRSGPDEHLPITLGGELARLLPEGALLLESRRWLVIADAHFGKGAAFRARGVPVPQGSTAATLQRLDFLIEREQPDAMVFLGDLFHARESHSDATLSALYAWRARHAALGLILVEGNHDLAAGPPPAQLRLQVETEPWRLGSIAFCHHPQRLDDVIVLAGHLHPAVRLVGRAGDSLRLPCFWLRHGLAILPAFGCFTGSACIEREEGDRVIAIAERRLYEIPSTRTQAATVS
jgi:DNA ligase-associated metallophosphoesterase